jgi:hypothetical protein
VGYRRQTSNAPNYCLRKLMLLPDAGGGHRDERETQVCSVGRRTRFNPGERFLP